MQRKGEGKMTKDVAGIRVNVEVQVVPGKGEVLAVLKRAATESEFLARLADDPHETLKEYYSLTSEERAALASGDIKKIESWVGKLDKELATWLWCRLSQEKY
jgi:bifunctional DNA-binding transcriptional regulator/antitoxin component of YhaV-PrlF toxin-antitoxin module